MEILAAIVPIFAVIGLGWVARSRGLVAPDFLDPANRLVYYLAIPAMIFRALANASLRTGFDVHALAAVIVSVTAVFGLTWMGVVIAKMDRALRGTFIQCCGHGNLGYLGFAVAFYYLGSEGLAKAAIIASFLIILQNALAILAHNFAGRSTNEKRKPHTMVLAVLGNPIILSAIAGLVFSLMQLSVPLIIDRCLEIISSLALPMALLLIGAALDFKKIRIKIHWVLIVSGVKLLLLPILGLVVFNMMGGQLHDFVPSLILLASPPATVVYVMAREMGGDHDMAVGAISAGTLISMATYAFWLHVVG